MIQSLLPPHPPVNLFTATPPPLPHSQAIKQRPKENEMSNRMDGTELLDLEPTVIELEEAKGGSGETVAYSFMITNHGPERGVVLRDYDFKAGMD